MIRDPDVFADDHLPRRLLHRDAEEEQLLRWWSRGQDVLLFGSSGVGKTTLAAHALDRFADERGGDVASVRAMDKTTAGILRAVLEEFPGPDPARTTPREDLALALRERVDGPTVVVLDEAEDLVATDALRRFADVDRLTICVICHDPDRWLSGVDFDSRRRLRSDLLGVERFSVDELADILQRRAAVGLRDGAVHRDQLREIADDVGGVARRGIQVLRAAAERAQAASHEQIRAADIDGAYALADRRILERNLASLPFHHQLLYELVRVAGSIQGGDLHDWYQEVAPAIYEGRARQPISRGDRRRKLAKLQDYGLVEREGATRATVYRAVDVDVVAPIDVAIPERPH